MGYAASDNLLNIGYFLSSDVIVIHGKEAIMYLTVATRAGFFEHIDILAY